MPAEPVRLHVVTLGTDTPPHDPTSCKRMVCDHQACITANGRRQPQGFGNAHAGLRAA